MRVERSVLRGLCNGLYAREPVRMIFIGGVRYTMEDFVLQPLEGARLDFVTNKNAQGLRMVKALALPLEMIFERLPRLQRR